MAASGELKLPATIGAYKVQRLLGQGGMGEVYLAEHAELERPVALKRFAPPPGFKDVKAAKERFLREGKALAKLQHQGIVAVHDLFEVRGDWFMAMELVDGHDVADLVERGPLPMDVVCLIGLGLAEALEHAHSHGIIHRDVKVANVMVSRQGQVKLMDFGIARGEVLERITQTGILVGTPKYIAPEALQSKEQTPLGDIYGLGAVMYHCLGGKRLFHNLGQQGVYKAILEGNIIPLRKHAPHVPRSLRKIVHRCLARKPEKRFQSAAEFHRELDLFMAEAGLFGSAAPRLKAFVKSFDEAGPDQEMDSVEISVGMLPQPTRRWVRRLVWIGIGVLLVALGAFGFWGALRLGWLDPVLEAMHMGGGG